VAQHVFVAPDLARIGGRLGPKALRQSDLVRVHFVASGCEDAVLAAVPEGRLPAASTLVAVVPVVADALSQLREHEDDLRFLRDCVGPDGFRVFLERWAFVAEGGAPSLLGPDLWPGQAEFVDATRDHDWLYVLKGRQVGLTTVESGYDGWVFRFGPQNARVHLFSHREDESQELLAEVAYGLQALPEWLRLPAKRQTGKVLDRAGMA
jgi:hypothetical protein